MIADNKILTAIGFILACTVVIVIMPMQLLASYKTKYSSNPPVEAHVGWVLSSNYRRRDSAKLVCVCHACSSSIV